MRYRFRGSIYFDVFVESEDLEVAREQATQSAQEVIDFVNDDAKQNGEPLCNLYIGGVARYTPQNLLKPFDRDI